ncbi:Krueppel homolog 1, partial [Gryllus bimaculatus]
MSSSFFSFQVEREPGDNFEDITFESIVKVEPGDNSDDISFETIEELKPLMRAFLDPEETSNGEEKLEHEDPLAMCNESFNGKSTPPSVGGEYGSFTESHNQVESYWEKSNGACYKGNDITLYKAEKKLNECAPSNKHSENDTHFSNPDNARQKDERLVCPTSLSENEHDISFPPKAKNLECFVCQKKFSRRSKLVRHMRSHSGERPYECSVCRKGFAHQDLAKHMRNHSGERSYECAVCQKSFLDRSALVRHMEIHSARRHECSICQKSFADRSYLVRHRRFHTGECPNECSVCQRSFVQKADLVTHMRIHNGERPFKCS